MYLSPQITDLSKDLDEEIIFLKDEMTLESKGPIPLHFELLYENLFGFISSLRWWGVCNKGSSIADVDPPS